MHVPEDMLRQPEPRDLFEERLYRIARRWHKRHISAISDLCNRMDATREQRHGAINVYLIERGRHVASD